MSARGILYQIARALGDISAISKGKPARRIKRKMIGRSIVRWLMK